MATANLHLLAQLDNLNEQQLRRVLIEHLTQKKLGLYWESSAIERDAALNAPRYTQLLSAPISRSVRIVSAAT